ncbi:MAG: anthrone oxygenase family protein [Xanthobacteraceae bacterium]
MLLLIGRGGRPLVFALLGLALYGVGAFMVTLFYSVPLNESLATVTPTPENAAQVWRGYVEPWVRWNALRTLMSVLALAAFIASFVTILLQPRR